MGRENYFEFERPQRKFSLPTANHRPTLMPVVTIAGAVCKPGAHALPDEARVSDGLAGAGGLVKSGELQASGVVTLRRPLPNRKVFVWQFDYLNPEAMMGDEPLLEAGDFLVAQYKVG